MRVFGLLAWHGWEYTRTAPCFLWIEGWPRQPGGLHPTRLIAAFFICSSPETSSSQRGCRRMNRQAGNAHR